MENTDTTVVQIPVDEHRAQVKANIQSLEALADSLRPGTGVPIPTTAATESGIPADSVVTLKDTEVEREQDRKLKGLEKREADAREAQRVLSHERNKLADVEKRIEQKVDSLKALLTQAEVTEKTLKASGPLSTVEEPAFLGELSSEAPELHGVIAPLYATVNNLVAQVKVIQEALNNQISSVRGQVAEARTKDIFEQLTERYPDWHDIVNSEPFEEWVKALPKSIRGAYESVLVGTDAYEFEDANAILAHYHRDNGGAVQAPTLKVNTPARQAPDSILDTVPLPAGRNSSGKSVDIRLTPLTEQEFRSWQYLFAKASPEERVILKNRRELYLDQMR